MSYKVRPIRWDLLVNPVSAGLETIAASNARLGQSIAGAGEDIGKGIVRSRLEAESKRRYGLDNQLAQDRLAETTRYHDEMLASKELRLAQQQQANDEALAADTEVAMQIPGMEDRVAQNVAALQKSQDVVDNSPWTISDSMKVDGYGLGVAGKQPAVSPSLAVPAAPTAGPVGINGIPTISSAVAEENAANVKTRLDMMTKQSEALRKRLNGPNLYSEAKRAEAKLAADRLDSAILALSAQYHQHVREAKTAKVAETGKQKADEVGATARANADLEFKTLKEELAAAGMETPQNLGHARLLKAQLDEKMKAKAPGEKSRNRVLDIKDWISENRRTLDDEGASEEEKNVARENIRAGISRLNALMTQDKDPNAKPFWDSVWAGIGQPDTAKAPATAPAAPAAASLGASLFPQNPQQAADFDKLPPTEQDKVRKAMGK